MFPRACPRERRTIRVANVPVRGHHPDAIDGAGREAELASGALLGDHGVHPLRRTDDRVDGTCGQASRAADAAVLVDDRGSRAGIGCKIRSDREFSPAQQLRQGANRAVSSRWTAIDRSAVCDRFGIRQTTGVTALLALRLRQQRIDPIDQLLFRRLRQRTSIPGSAPLSGDSRKMFSPPGPAASTMPFDSPNFILRGARFATTTVSRPTSCSGE